jgi:hypothetical protein
LPTLSASSTALSLLKALVQRGKQSKYTHITMNKNESRDSIEDSCNVKRSMMGPGLKFFLCLTKHHAMKAYWGVEI